MKQLLFVVNFIPFYLSIVSVVTSVEKCDDGGDVPTTTTTTAKSEVVTEWVKRITDMKFDCAGGGHGFTAAASHDDWEAAKDLLEIVSCDDPNAVYDYSLKVRGNGFNTGIGFLTFKYTCTIRTDYSDPKSSVRGSSAIRQY